MSEFSGIDRIVLHQNGSLIEQGNPLPHHIRALLPDTTIIVMPMDKEMSGNPAGNLTYGLNYFIDQIDGVVILFFTVGQDAKLPDKMI